jgi:mediator of RNA polymerase II transcription subunit 5
VDLIVAGFDVLACAVDRNETTQTMFCLKSFLTNKIPTLLTTLATSMYPPLSPEYCISEALQHVDLNTFPAFGLGMMSNSALADVRQEFIYACTLHGLLPTASVDRLLGEIPFTPPPTQESRYVKETLVQQCATEPGKAVQLIEELDKLDGNASAIVAAVTEVCVPSICFISRC